MFSFRVGKVKQLSRDAQCSWLMLAGEIEDHTLSYIVLKLFACSTLNLANTALEHFLGNQPLRTSALRLFTCFSPQLTYPAEKLVSYRKRDGFLRNVPGSVPKQSSCRTCLCCCGQGIRCVSMCLGTSLAFKNGRDVTITIWLTANRAVGLNISQVFNTLLILPRQSFIFLTLKVNISIYLYMLSMQIKYGKYFAYISAIGCCFIPQPLILAHIALQCVSSTFYLRFEEQALAFLS